MSPQLQRLLPILLILSTLSEDTHATELHWATGPAFEQAADSWISLTYLDLHNQLRPVCHDLAATQKVSVLLDRRLDPRRPIPLETPLSGPFQEVISQIATSQQATSRRVGDSLYILPPHRASDFKTLIALRTSELPKALEKSHPSNTQRISLLRQRTEPRSFSWPRLARPRDLVLQAFESTGVTPTNPDIIPHDLWDAGTLPRATLVEFVSFVLFQYDLTFHWEPGHTVQIVPIPEQVEIERYHSLSADFLAEHKPKLAEQYPQATWQQRGSRWQIVGSEDLHEQLNALKVRKSTATGRPRVPWQSHTFTMRVERNPLDDVFDYLQQSGVPVEYKAERLKQLGIDPQQRVSFAVTDVKAEGLFEAICKPLNLPYRITDEAILIAPED